MLGCIKSEKAYAGVLKIKKLGYSGRILLGTGKYSHLL